MLFPQKCWAYGHASLQTSCDGDLLEPMHIKIFMVTRSAEPASYFLVQHYAQCELLPREDPVSPDARAALQFARA